MLNPFICGAFHPKEDSDELGAGAGATSRSSTPRRKHNFCRTRNSNSNHNKNPYSTRGLDKFEALLADIKEEKKKIYGKDEAGNISLVRFVPTSSNNLVPIVVKLKDSNSQPGSPLRTEETSDEKHMTHHSENLHQSKAVKRKDSELKAETNKKKGSSWKPPSWDQWRRPSYYVPAAIILILVFLAFFGRSAAILCTTIGWYMIPMLKGGSPGSEKNGRSEKKKELGRRSSENKIIAITKRSPDRSPRRHDHQRS